MKEFLLERLFLITSSRYVTDIYRPGTLTGLVTTGKSQ